MTVLHVISGLGIGGAEAMLVRVAGALKVRGLRQHVVSVGVRGNHAEELEDNGIDVTALGLTSIYGAAGGAIWLARIVSHLQPTVVQGWMYHGNLLAAASHRLAPHRANRRLFWNLRASNMDKERYGRLIRWGGYLSSWPDIVVANSRAGADFHRSQGFHPRRLEIISNGIDTNVFRPDADVRAAVRLELGISDDAVVAILVARVDPMKDHATFLAAMAAIPHVHGLLVGSGTEALQLPPNVQALGLRQDTAKLYACADIVVSTSAFGEGFSNVIAEGMSTGLVPIATDVGDARLIVGEAGYIVVPHDAVGLAKVIAAQATASPAERQLQGMLARARIVNQFTLKHAVDAFARLYADA